MGLAHLPVRSLAGVEITVHAPLLALPCLNVHWQSRYYIAPSYCALRAALWRLSGLHDQRGVRIAQSAREGIYVADMAL